MQPSTNKIASGADFYLRRFAVKLNGYLQQQQHKCYSIKRGIAVKIQIKYLPTTDEAPPLTVTLPELEPEMVFRDGRHTVTDGRVYYAWEDLVRDLKLKPDDAAVEIRLYRESIGV